MPRKKRKNAKQPTLPLIAGEVWEVGQRPMTGLVPVLDEHMSEPPAMLFVVEVDSEAVVFGAPLLPDAPASEMAECVRQAMREPLSGEPRRPEVIRVSSDVEAEVLRTALAEAEITIEVTERLAAIDAIHNRVIGMLGHIQSDYRTHVEADGETLSDASLHALYSVARQFYRKALWEDFNDAEIFSIAVRSANGAPRPDTACSWAVWEKSSALRSTPRWTISSEFTRPISTPWNNSKCRRTMRRWTTRHWLPTSRWRPTSSPCRV